jgi:hypothetical protein|tara:strand:+ start:140 stop:628 length:489 start_codon:yes stop_codon:yes gene_type:complete
MDKKANVWISAVIFTGLGLAIMAIILAAGLPAIETMKDTYATKQTKELMLVLDKNIREVHNEGPGSQRQLKLKINKGDFNIGETSINWSLRTKAVLSEPGFQYQEGNLIILTQESAQQGEYDLQLTLEYTQIQLNSTEDTLKGTNLLSISNQGGGVIKLIKL